MSKHTPGPWEIDWYICRAGNEELWRVPRSIGPVYTDHNHWAGNYITADKADAHLIAAAPDLLEALKKLDNFFETYRPEDHPVSDPHELVRAAIKKAEEA